MNTLETLTMTTPGGPGSASQRVYTVSEITWRIKNSLEKGFRGVWTVGEASNIRSPGSGHVYMTLKDEDAQLQAVMFRAVASRVPFTLKDGMQVVAYGSISVYPPRGQYQLIIETIEPKGIGPLQLAFLQLKNRLEKEGLFDIARKRPLPFMPQRVAIVSSITGAAIRDMLKIIHERSPQTEILVYPVKVQGEGAAGEIARAVTDISDDVSNSHVDVIIVGRGGGSIEDLWAFNEEIVARSIFASSIPVISAVGHETDFSISDFVADRRAPTPSVAAQMVAPEREELLERTDTLASRMSRAVHGKLEAARSTLEDFPRRYGFHQPQEMIRMHKARVEELLYGFSRGMEHALALKRERLAGTGSKIESLSPLKVLSRGYSITTMDSKTLNTARGLRRGDRIETRFHKGSAVSVVEETKR
ncbi:MAG: exodeoxyribonuclease VII large subunit [Candidatus Brocadiales bacterium]